MEWIQQFTDYPVFNWVILPALIFVSRIFDVSFGTLRIIFVSRGKRSIAPFLGFFEVLIWLLAISQIMQNLNNFACYIAYAGGFAMGNYIGMRIEEKLAMGTMIIRVFLVGDGNNMKEKLHNAGFGVTSIDAHGANGNVKIIYTIIKRKALDKVVGIIEACDAKAFYSIEEVRAVKEGIFPSDEKRAIDSLRLARSKGNVKKGK